MKSSCTGCSIASLFLFFLTSLSLHQVMGTSKQWVRFGPAKNLWSLVLTSWLTAVPPVHLPLRGPLFATPWVSEGRTSLRDQTPPHHTLPSQTPPAHHLTLTSPRGREQQPPWCCHRDKEMNCECLDVNMWLCSLIIHANKNRHVDEHAWRGTHEFKCVHEAFIAKPRSLSTWWRRTSHVFSSSSRTG